MHYLAQSQANLGIILDPTATENLQTKRLLNASEITLLVGPEGGFHAEEITAAHAHGFTSCRLGPRILRAETAALAGLSILQAIAGDLCY
jgi:16S rRNA (uracil1498-N3)-methyltransferase